MSETLSRTLRDTMVNQLLTESAVGNSRWSSALRQVPREVFVPAYFHAEYSESNTIYTPHSSENTPIEEWLTQIYTDQTLITQLNNTVWAEDMPAPLSGASPTSSSTHPSLVVSMLEELDPHTSDRVLEIGTGTGYSTALLCHELPNEQITSIEYDPGVALRAHKALHSLNYTPHLVVGDGVQGAPEQAPYDCIIATCSLRGIPGAWIKQARPGGRILTTLTGSLHGSGLVKLTIHDNGTASGHFLAEGASFMLARTQSVHDNAEINLLHDVSRHPTEHGPEILDDTNARFVAQFTAPYVEHFPIDDTEIGSIEYLTDSATGSIAVLIPTHSGWDVKQYGTRSLWDEITAAITAWQQAGKPPQEAFHLTTNGVTHTITVEETALQWTYKV